jgi:hypothetical protein
MKVVPLRLQPGNDLRKALEAWMGDQQRGRLSGGAAAKNETFRRYRHDNVWRLDLGGRSLRCSNGAIDVAN